MKNRATAERAAPPLGVLVSIVLHVGLVVALFVTFTRKIDIPANDIPVVPVDLVTVADQNNIAPSVKPDETPPPEPKMAETAPPEIAPPKVEIAPDVKPLKKEKKKDEAKFDPDAISKLLDKKKTANAKMAAHTVKGYGNQTDMSVDLATSLFNQIRRCWTPPQESPHPERLVVLYNVHLRRDGSVADAVLTPESDIAGRRDPYMRAANEAAGRAIFTCAPYRLPANRYGEWSSFTFRFNPADVIGQ